MGATTPARSGVYRSDPVKRNGLNACCCCCDDDMQSRGHKAVVLRGY